MRSLKWLTLAILTLTGCDGSSPKSPVEKPPVEAPADGVKVVPGIGTHTMNTEDTTALGGIVKDVRYTLYWNMYVDHPHYPITWDEQVRAAEERFDLLVVVHGDQPEWGGYNDRYAVYQKFADFMGETVRKHPDVRYWQLWNEMNCGFTDLFGALGGHDAYQGGRDYAAMSKLTYSAIKEANPDAQVVSGPLSLCKDWKLFLNGMYDAGAEYDIFSINVYGFPAAPVVEETGRYLRELQRDRGDTRPVWLTEFGLEEKQVPWAADQKQLDDLQLTTWKDIIEGNRWYDRLYGYQLWTNEDRGHGILMRDRTPRPTYLWLERRFEHGS